MIYIKKLRLASATSVSKFSLVAQRSSTGLRNPAILDHLQCNSSAVKDDSFWSSAVVALSRAPV